jgi:hypothetical protein
MSAVMTAIFDQYGVADRVRLDLVRDGFPTDRVDLTAACDPGRAALTPAQSSHERLMRHFLVLFGGEAERPYVERLAERIEHGGAVVTVHPRGALETRRAREILERAQPLEVGQHDLANQGMEHAASGHDQPWISSLWIESDPTEADCIYCRLFEHPHH